MTDRDFDDPSYDGLRSLLADAAAPAALPADVAASLDATLAGLVAERATDEDRTVVPLKRRFAPQRFLVAAAAVVLVGGGVVGLSQVLDGAGQGQDDSASSAVAGTAESAPLAPLESASGGVPGAAPGVPNAGTGTTSGDSGGKGVYSYEAELNRLVEANFTVARFDKQVLRLVNEDGERSAAIQDDVAKAPRPTSPEGDQLTNLSGAYKADVTCPGPEVTAGGTALRISFEESPAVLVLHPVVDGSRYVAAWSCDGKQLLAYTTVPG